MRIFISDLHLGDGTRTDDFHRDKEFLGFLDFVEKEAKELIIAGDLFELWQASLDKILFKHKEVVKRLLGLKKKIKLTYLVGNHDYIPFTAFLDKESGLDLEYSDKEKGIIAEHGHRYDIFNRYQNPLQALRWPKGKYFSLFLASLERLIYRDVDVWMKKALIKVDDFLQQAALIKNKVTPSSPAYLKRGGHFGEFAQAVEAHLTRGYKIVIFGHTHQAQLQVIEKGIYANCGAWTDAVTPTYIAYTPEKISLCSGLSHQTIKEIRLS
ncbi:MAG: UDP-2,3-diacylglucosamine diphosphatase [Candidatus Omnitrophica bacterium]|nr:UDP-2,3-diacylglucosamine diphosphatase [Candidatus Omnitrophota bacterium]MCM8770996.1 UDP-2,3-diacylglucosamine diphosphatase [Candidatus Omnitrophota bacterium]